MKRVVLVFVLAACGGSTQHAKVEEVPIEQGGGSGTSLPPDDGDSGSTTVTTVPTGSAPPGVGPQSLDTPPPQQDAGAATTPAAPPQFVQRANGLTQKECTDMVMAFAKLVTKENKTTAPAATDIPKDPIYGQMLADCGQSTTKKQKTCAMATRTSAAWKKCME